MRCEKGALPCIKGCIGTFVVYMSDSKCSNLLRCRRTSAKIINTIIPHVPRVGLSQPELLPLYRGHYRMATFEIIA